MSLDTESDRKGVKILGLRERKKQQTRENIAKAAVSLFLRDGFDRVSVSDVAAAADVSKVTVFNYFPTKEDLVLSKVADYIEHSAQVVRDRGENESPLQALKGDYRRRIANRDPSTGLSGDERVVAIQRMISTTPSLTVRLTHHLLAAETSLTAALAEYLGEPADNALARLAASQLLAAERALVSRNLQRILAGWDRERLYAEAVSEAELAFGVLSSGLAGAGFCLQSRRRL